LERGKLYPVVIDAKLGFMIGYNFFNTKLVFDFMGVGTMLRTIHINIYIILKFQPFKALMSNNYMA
jgi:hypothetical protein